MPKSSNNQQVQRPPKVPALNRILGYAVGIRKASWTQFQANWTKNDPIFSKFWTIINPTTSHSPSFSPVLNRPGLATLCLTPLLNNEESCSLLYGCMVHPSNLNNVQKWRGKSCFPGLPTAEGTKNPAYNDQANASLFSSWARRDPQQKLSSDEVFKTLLPCLHQVPAG